MDPSPTLIYICEINNVGQLEVVHVQGVCTCCLSPHAIPHTCTSFMYMYLHLMESRKHSTCCVLIPSRHHMCELMTTECYDGQALPSQWVPLPVYPARHLQKWPPIVLTHSDLSPWQSLLLGEAHSSISNSQLPPLSVCFIRAKYYDDPMTIHLIMNSTTIHMHIHVHAYMYIIDVNAWCHVRYIRCIWTSLPV